MSGDTLTPRIYVASLAAYNNGELHGTWIDATAGEPAVWNEIHRMLRTSPVGPAEEWAIHDYEGFGPLRLDEYESISHVCQVATGIADYGIEFAVWAEVLDRAEWDDQLEAFEDHFEGEYDSYEAFGEQILDMLGFDLDNLESVVPEALLPYVTIDVTGFGQGWASAVRHAWFEGRLYVFFD